MPGPVVSNGPLNQTQGSATEPDTSSSPEAVSPLPPNLPASNGESDSSSPSPSSSHELTLPNSSSAEPQSDLAPSTEPLVIAPPEIEANEP